MDLIGHQESHHRDRDRQTEQVFELAIFLEIKFGLLSCCMLLVTCILKYIIIIPTIV